MAELRPPRPVSAAAAGTILVINCGSSSVKFALFAKEEPQPRL